MVIESFVARLGSDMHKQPTFVVQATCYTGIMEEGCDMEAPTQEYRRGAT